MSETSNPSVRSEYRTLVTHSSHYFVAQIAAMAAGFISLPILTRALSREDFGRMSLVLLSVNLLANFARLGIPQSVPRHFAEYRSRGDEVLRSYVSTLLLCTLGIAAVLPCAGAVGEGVVALFAPHIPPAYVLLIGLLLSAEVLLSLLSELYRAELRSLATAALSVISRYGTLAGSLAFFFWVSPTLAAFLFGKALVALLIAALYLVPLVAGGQLRWRRPDTAVIREAVRFGLPLAFAASGGFFIAYGDRYVIQALLDSTQVAIYSLPYDLMQSLEQALTTPIRLAIMPIVFGLLAGADGKVRAEAFLSQVVRGVFLVVVPMILGMSFLGRDIVVLLASEKYAESSRLVPMLATGVLLGGLNFLFTVGLAFQKRTGVIANLTLSAGLLNILLNLLLVPWLGVAGSAWATLATYAVVLVVSFRLSSRYVRIHLFPGSALCAGVAGAAMLAVLAAVRPALPTGPAALVVLVPVGVLAYGGVLVALDRDVRRYLIELLRERRLVPRLAA